MSSHPKGKAKAKDMMVVARAKDGASQAGKAWAKAGAKEYMELMINNDQTGINDPIGAKPRQFHLDRRLSALGCRATRVHLLTHGRNGRPPLLNGRQEAVACTACRRGQGKCRF